MSLVGPALGVLEILLKHSMRPTFITNFLNHNAACGDQFISGTSVQLCCSGGYMPTLADIYEISSGGMPPRCCKGGRSPATCFDAQARTCVAKGCRSIETRPAIAARKCPRERQKHLGAVRKVRRDLHLSSRGVTRFKWGQRSVELYEPQELQRTTRG